MADKTPQRSENVTRLSFIETLKESSELAWSVFYDNYAPLIMNFAKQRGCSDTLAEDVLQETVIALMQMMSNFEYDREKGKFRSLLFKITESKVVDAFRRNKRHVYVQDPEVIPRLEPITESMVGLQNLWDRNWENNILGMAMNKAKLKVRPMTFECFERVFIEGESVADVATKLGVSPNLVSQHKHKVWTLIMREAEKLKLEYGE